FNLATAGKASLTIRDVAGKVIRTVNGEYAAGMNTISIEKSDINTVGVLYYTLISDDFSDTKKMIIVD
ncbi:MAG: T9SS type A sorting domain-containing protein, partial [Saprospiraceae bacterium]